MLFSSNQEHRNIIPNAFRESLRSLKANDPLIIILQGNKKKAKTNCLHELVFSTTTVVPITLTQHHF